MQKIPIASSITNINIQHIYMYMHMHAHCMLHAAYCTLAILYRIPVTWRYRLALVLRLCWYGQGLCQYCILHPSVNACCWLECPSLK
jgi:hypothetical protein